MRHAFALALLLLAAPASAETIVIDFEGEPIATHEDPFQPAGCGGCVELAETGGGPLSVRSGATLLIGEEGGALRITFLVPVTAFSIDFGGDFDSPYITAGPARLRGFAGGVEVALDELAANQNELVDQTLTIAPGVVLDHAIFSFQQSDEFEPISPTVDNLVLTTVPEPGTLGLAVLALAGLLSRRAGRPVPRLLERELRGPL